MSDAGAYLDDALNIGGTFTKANNVLGIAGTIDDTYNFITLEQGDALETLDNTVLQPISKAFNNTLVDITKPYFKSLSTRKYKPGTFIKRENKYYRINTDNSKSQVERTSDNRFTWINPDGKRVITKKKYKK